MKNSEEKRYNSVKFGINKSELHDDVRKAGAFGEVSVERGSILHDRENAKGLCIVKRGALFEFPGGIKSPNKPEQRRGGP